MIRFLLIRLTQTIIVLYTIATVVFFMIKSVPGGPFSQDKNVSAVILERLEAQYGLNDPLHVQYLKFIWSITPKKLHIPELVHFDLREGLGIDLGYSFRYEGRTVNQLIKQAFPVSLELGCYALVFATFLGILVGTIAALKQNTKWDYIPMGFMMMGICVPTFVMGPLLVMVFGFMMPESMRLPVLFWQSPNPGGYWQQLSHKILPTVTLGLYYAASIARLTRGSMLEVMMQDFIRTARAKGLSECTIVIKHGLRAGMIPVMSYLGPVAAHLITGSFIVEYIDMLPRMGRHLINAALNRDYTLIMGTVLLYASILVFFNLVVDILVIMLNPKLKFSEA